METKQTYTSGPWRYRLSQLSDKKWSSAEVHGLDGSIVAFCNSRVSPNETNARLIAAAPDYDANAREFVKDAEETLKPGSTTNFMILFNLLLKHWDKARITIAKAEGK
jgi:hypothetical protein